MTMARNTFLSSTFKWSTVLESHSTISAKSGLGDRTRMRSGKYLGKFWKLSSICRIGESSIGISNPRISFWMVKTKLSSVILALPES
jgi:hypothetical protein